MADRYMVFVPGSPNPPQGPFSLEELRAALAASKLPPEARVSTVGNTTWVPITEVVPPAVVVPEPSTTEPLAAVDALAPPPPVGSMATAAPVQPQNVVASPKADGPKRKVVLAVAGALGVVTFVGVGVMLMMLTRPDKAQPDYDKCVGAETVGDLEGASDACRAAVSADPTSVSGKAAAEKLRTLKEKSEAKARALAEVAAKAKVDAEAAAKRASLCADLAAWLPPLGTKARDIDGIMSRFIEGNRAANAAHDVGAMWTAWGTLSEETAANGKETRRQQATLKDHAVLNGEGPIQRDILRSYDVLAHMYEMYSESLSDTKTPKGLPRLTYVGKDIPKTTKTTDDAIANIRSRCGKLASATQGTPAVGAAAPPEGPVPEMVAVVHVPAGTFVMGTDSGSPSEGPAHRVRLTRDFWIDKTEVTVAAYQACVNAGACTATGIRPMCNATVPERANNPINCIDRSQAETYCKFAKKRLPTEAEWEYAARGADERMYPWGNDNPSCTLGAFGNVPGGKQCRTLESRTVDVGQFPSGATRGGALDMAGNVWEWVSDKWDAEAYSKSQPTNPFVVPAGDVGILRGGSWDFPAVKSKSTYRLKFGAAEWGESTGVRCVSDVASSATTPAVQGATPLGQVHAAHVLVQWLGSSDSTQSRSKAEALARAKEAKAKLDAGEDFASVASMYDDDGARARGGDLGTFAPGTFPKPFETAVTRLDVGSVSDIVETRFGFHIIKRLP